MSILSDLLEAGFSKLLTDTKESITIDGDPYTCIVATMWPTEVMDISGTTESYTLSLELTAFSTPFKSGTLIVLRGRTYQLSDCIKKVASWQITVNNARLSADQSG